MSRDLSISQSHVSENKNIVYFVVFFFPTFLFIQDSSTHKKVRFIQIVFCISAFIYWNCRSNKWSIIPTAQILFHMGRIIFLSETLLLYTGLLRWSPPKNISWDMHHLLWKHFIVLMLSDSSFVTPCFFSQQFTFFWVDMQILLQKLRNAGPLSKCKGC